MGLGANGGNLGAVWHGIKGAAKEVGELKRGVSVGTGVQSNFGQFKRFAKELKALHVDRAQRKQILGNIRDNFQDYAAVKISRTSRERSFWRRWGQFEDGSGAREVGRYGTMGPRTAEYTRNRLAVLDRWNALTQQTRFRIRKGSLLIEGPTAPKVEPTGVGRLGGGHQLFVPNTGSLFK